MLGNEQNDEIVPEVGFLDIETEGLAATDEVLCIGYGGEQLIRTSEMSEEYLLLKLASLVSKMPMHTVATYFGGPKYGSTQGFDFPVLRTRYILNGIPEAYPFSEMNHIDMSEVTKKFFCTRTMQEPTLELLSAAQVKELTVDCALHPLTTKEANICQLRAEPSNLQDAIDNFILKNVTLKAVEHHSLDRTYKLFNPDAIDEKYGGADMKMLYEMYLTTGESKWLDEISIHNNFCITKLEYLYKIFIKSKLVSSLSVPFSRL